MIFLEKQNYLWTKWGNPWNRRRHQCSHNYDTGRETKKINSREREIVLLKDIYGYKFREISKLKNMNLSTVKSIYYKGIKDMGGTG